MKYRQLNNGIMPTNENETLKLGARLFPGVDLTLWLTLIVTSLLVVVAAVGGVALLIH